MWGPEGWRPKGGKANISRFFSLSRHIFWCLKHQFAGCRVPGGPKARGCSCHGPTRDVLFSGDKKIVIDIFGGSKRHGWGSTVGDPEKQHKQQQKQHKTELKKNSNTNKTSSKNNRKHKQQAAQAEASFTNNSTKNTKQQQKQQKKQRKQQRQQHKQNQKATQEKIFGHRGFT